MGIHSLEVSHSHDEIVDKLIRYILEPSISIIDPLLIYDIVDPWWLNVSLIKDDLTKLKTCQFDFTKGSCHPLIVTRVKHRWSNVNFQFDPTCPLNPQTSNKQDDFILVKRVTKCGKDSTSCLTRIVDHFSEACLIGLPFTDIGLNCWWFTISPDE